MKFSKKIVSAAAAMLLCAASFAETYYVAVKNANLKAKASGSSKNIASVSYGDAVTWVKEEGNWTFVSTGKKEGWISTNAITKRKVVASSRVTTDAKEIALAGKGFGDGMSADSESTNSSAVNAVEANRVSDGDNASFKAKGGLKASE